jgi:hypothetical protein
MEWEVGISVINPAKDYTHCERGASRAMYYQRTSISDQLVKLVNRGHNVHTDIVLYAVTT